MKITKRQLRQMIREEFMREAPTFGDAPLGTPNRFEQPTSGRHVRKSRPSEGMPQLEGEPKKLSKLEADKLFPGALDMLFDELVRREDPNVESADEYFYAATNMWLFPGNPPKFVVEDKLGTGQYVWENNSREWIQTGD